MILEIFRVFGNVVCSVRLGINGITRTLPNYSKISSMFDAAQASEAELGSLKDIEYAQHIMKAGSRADRQLATYRRTETLQAVVDQLIRSLRKVSFDVDGAFAFGKCNPLNEAGFVSRSFGRHIRRESLAWKAQRDRQQFVPAIFAILRPV